MTLLSNTEEINLNWLAQELHLACADFISSSPSNLQLQDLQILPGRCSARASSNGKTLLLSLHLPEFEQATWGLLFELFTEKPFYYSLILAQNFTQDLTLACKDRGISLIPQAVEINFAIDGKSVQKENSPEFSTLYRACCNYLSINPFHLFYLRGISYEELIVELRKRRKKYHRPLENLKDKDFSFKELDVVSPAGLNQFYKTTEKLNQLNFNIKADEIPASVLKWLDPLPLLGIEDIVDCLLQEAYEKVARLAQSYGIGI
jgi:uncharacterized Zn finger protein